MLKNKTFSPDFNRFCSISIEGERERERKREKRRKECKSIAFNAADTSILNIVSAKHSPTKDRQQKEAESENSVEKEHTKCL